MFNNKWKIKAVKLQQELDDLRWNICKGKHDWVEINREYISETYGKDLSCYINKKCSLCGLEDTRRGY